MRLIRGVPPAISSQFNLPSRGGQTIFSIKADKSKMMQKEAS
jgi:hypothetical protein